MNEILYLLPPFSYSGPMAGRISEKGQVTIPKKVRDALGIRPGDLVDFTVREGELIGRRRAPEIPWAEVYGMLKTDKTTDELMRELRGDPLW
jgi:antitoxin PrlF